MMAIDFSGFDQPLNADEEERKRRQRLETIEKRSEGGIGNTLLNLIPFGTITRKAIQGEKITPGEVGIEAALTAIPFLRVGKLAKTAKGIVRPSSRAAPKAPQLPDDVGRLRFGERLQADVRGIKPGVGKTATRKGLTTKDTVRLNKLADELGLSTGGSARQLREIEVAKSAQGKIIGELVKANNARLPAGTIAQLRDSIIKRVNKTPGVELTKAFQSDLKKLSNAKSVKSLNDIRRLFDNLVRNFDKPIGGDAAKANLAKLTRTEIDRFISRIAPDLKAANLKFSDIRRLENLLQASVKGAKPLKQSPLGLTFPIASAQGAQAAKSVIGAIARKSIAPRGSLRRQALKQAGVRVGANVLGLRGQELPPRLEDIEFDESLPSDISQVDLGASGLDEAGLGQDLGGFPASEGQLEFSSAELANAAIRAMQAGDEQATESLMSAAQFAQKYEASLVPETAKLTAQSKTQISNLRTADKIVNELESRFGATGGGQGLLGGALTKISGKLRLNSQALAFEGIRGGYISRLVRALGEVGTLNEGDIQRAIGLVPDVTDTPESAQIKFSSLRSILRESEQSVLSTDQPAEELLAQSLPVSPYDVDFSQYGGY